MNIPIYYARRLKRLKLCWRILIGHDHLVVASIDSPQLLHCLRSQPMTIKCQSVDLDDYVSQVIIKQLAAQHDELDMGMRQIKWQTETSQYLQNGLLHRCDTGRIPHIHDP